MATASFDDSNILDTGSFNWRLVVYPLVGALILLVGGSAFYYYEQNRQIERENQAREALVQTKEPLEMERIADTYPGTTQASLALLNAAAEFFTRKDYAAAERDYQRVTLTPKIDPNLRDSAQIGLASSLEAAGKLGDAIDAYLAVAHRGKGSSYAPFAYHAAAALYEQQGDKENEKKLLLQLSSLNSGSPFEQDAASRLQKLDAPPLVINPASATPTSSATPAKK